MSIFKLLVPAILALISTTAIAQSTKVVVIPLGGGNEMTVITASINANVTVARSNDSGLGVNRNSSSSLSTGDYVITTSTDISNCTYIATLGGPVRFVGPGNGEITARPSISGSNNLYIQTSDSAGTKADLPFHVIIMCG